MKPGIVIATENGIKLRGKPYLRPALCAVMGHRWPTKVFGDPAAIRRYGADRCLRCGKRP